MIPCPESLHNAPRKRQFFFLSHHFNSSLKDSVISDKEYEAAKKFYNLLNLDNLGKLNKLYNFQDTVILTELFEQISNRLQERFKFNPRKCNSASSFCGCVHRGISKYFIALPTNSEHTILLEKTLIGSFSCANSRIAFDSQILYLTKTPTN